MRAVTIPAHGGPEVLQPVTGFPDPRPAADEALIRVRATGVNRMDFLVREGYPGLSLPLPHICGGDIVGEVVEVGSGASAAVGSRVVVYPLVSCGECSLCRSGRTNLCSRWKSVGIHLKGGYAEYAVVPARNLYELPDGVSYEEAVSVPVAGLTAHHAINSVGEVAAGETVFIWGGCGALGSMAVQMAKEAGAVVITTARTSERAETTRRLGADHCLDPGAADLAEQARRLAPEGIAVVLDYLGSAAFPTSFSLLRNGGRLLVCGIMTGRTAELNIHATYYRHVSIHGLFLGTPQDMRRTLDLVATKRVRPLIGAVLPLEQAAEAHRRVAAEANVGKIVLQV